jgi:tRNA pseudouridine32 synthase/23S rRNA pseudouridine746 synthase
MIEGAPIEASCPRCRATHRLAADPARGAADRLIAAIERARMPASDARALPAYTGYRASARNPVFDPCVDARPLFAPGGGKMFGVLVVETPTGETRALRAFSGTYGGRWVLPGWAPPVFDVVRWHALERAHDPAIADLTQGMEDATPVQRSELAARRSRQSAALMSRYHSLYELVSPGGEARALLDVLAPRRPVAGSGDCCAPKLLTEANRRGWRPLGLVEVFLGSPRRPGGRVHRRAYPPCSDKCVPLLPFLLCAAERSDAD